MASLLGYQAGVRWRTSIKEWHLFTVSSLQLRGEHWEAVGGTGQPLLPEQQGPFTSTQVRGTSSITIKKQMFLIKGRNCLKLAPVTNNLFHWELTAGPPERPWGIISNDWDLALQIKALFSLSLATYLSSNTHSANLTRWTLRVLYKQSIHDSWFSNELYDNSHSLHFFPDSFLTTTIGETYGLWCSNDPINQQFFKMIPQVINLLQSNPPRLFPKCPWII